MPSDSVDAHAQASAHIESEQPQTTPAYQTPATQQHVRQENSSKSEEPEVVARLPSAKPQAPQHHVDGSGEGHGSNIAQAAAAESDQASKTHVLAVPSAAPVDAASVPQLITATPLC